jgi:hypothetical protein
MLRSTRNDEGPGVPIYNGTFDGLPVDTNSILVKYTYNGDADLNGKIDADDYFQIDNGFAKNLTGYRNGDFDYNGTVDADDYFLIDNAFANQSGVLADGAASAVPEPSLSLLLGVCILAMDQRQRLRIRVAADRGSQ